MDNSNIIVVVLSRNYSTGLGVIRSLGMAGYTVDLIASTKKRGSSLIPSSSKYIRNSVEVLCKNIQTDNGEGIIKEILKYKNSKSKKIVIFPTDDFTSKIISLNYNKLAPYFVMPFINGNKVKSIADAMDKVIQHKIATEIGIATPKEWIFDLNYDIEINNDIVFPCFVKPYQSVYGSKNEMAVINDKKGLYNHLNCLKQKLSDRKIIVQEYLRIDKEYDLSGVCLNQKIIIPAVIEKTRISKHEKGVTLSGRILPTDVIGKTLNLITKMLKQFNYTGMFDMELAVCSGKIYFNEINFRSGGPNYAYQLSGVNLPDILVKELLGYTHNLSEEKIHKYGQTFVYEKVAWEDYINSHISKLQLKECINNCNFTLLNDRNDTKPGKIFNRRIRLSLIKHKILNLLSKEKSFTDTKATSKGNVVVMGYNYCNILTMVRALGQKGYNVSVLRIYKSPPSLLKPLQSMVIESKSKYITEYHQCIANDNDCVINKLLEISNSTKSLLIPTDDFSLCIADNNINRLNEHYFLPSINKKQGEIVRLMDKHLQKNIAEKHNIPVLNDTVIKAENRKYVIPDEISYPCFVKPNTSTKSAKEKIKKCADKNELATVLESFSQYNDFEILVEPFVNIKTEYSLLGLCAGKKAIIPGKLKVNLGGHRQRKGVAIYGETVDYDKLNDIAEKCKEFVLSLNYTGLFDIDLVESTDGTIYFLELNFRAGASTQALTAQGINMPDMLADYLLNRQEINENCEIKIVNDKFISEKILIEEYARGDINKKDALKLIKSSNVFFIKDYNDDNPSKYLNRYTVIVKIIRIFHRIKDFIR